MCGHGELLKWCVCVCVVSVCFCAEAVGTKEGENVDKGHFLISRGREAKGES